MKPYFILTFILILIMIILPFAVRLSSDKSSNAEQTIYDYTDKTHLTEETDKNY